MASFEDLNSDPKIVSKRNIFKKRPINEKLGVNFRPKKISKKIYKIEIKSK